MNKIVIVLLVAFVVAGCSSSGSGGGTTSPPAAAPTTAPGQSRGVEPGSTTGSTSSGSTSSTRSSATTANTPALHNFRVADVTWVGSHGWALGEADCLSGSGQCDAIEQTTGGHTWTSLPAPRAQTYLGVSTCAADCLNGLRFATPQIGYAYGPESFYTTTDGGHTWTHRSGGAVFVETANGSTLRVVSTRDGCPGPCDVALQTAPIGVDKWTTRFAPRGLADYGLLFGRTGARAYLLVEGHVAGGGNSAESTLYTSADDGRTWANRGEPCPQLDSEDDSVALSSGPDGSAAVVCRARVASSAVFVAVSTDGGASFHAGSHTALGSAAVTGFAAASDKIVLVVQADTFRSPNGGRTFTRLAANSGSSPGDPGYIGFSSTSLGHAISDDRRTLFTTTDAGHTWSAHRFG